MIPKESAYSEQAHYAHWSAFKVKTVNIINQNIVVTWTAKAFRFLSPMYQKNTPFHMLSQMLLSHDGEQPGCHFGKIS